MNLPLVFLIAAFVVFVLAVWPVTARWNLVAAGLALLVLSMLVAGKAHADDRTPPLMPHRAQQHHWHQGHVKHPQTCREWRREVRHHPRLILPRRCHHAQKT